MIDPLIASTGIPHWQADCAQCGQELALKLIEDGTITWTESLMQPMWLCPVCGNKRCPKASWHGFKCTGSNKTGQIPEFE